MRNSMPHFPSKFKIVSNGNTKNSCYSYIIPGEEQDVVYCRDQFNKNGKNQQ